MISFVGVTAPPPFALSAQVITPPSAPQLRPLGDKKFYFSTKKFKSTDLRGDALPTLRKKKNPQDFKFLFLLMSQHRSLEQHLHAILKTTILHSLNHLLRRSKNPELWFLTRSFGYKKNLFSLEFFFSSQHLICSQLREPRLLRCWAVSSPRLVDFLPFVLCKMVAMPFGNKETPLHYLTPLSKQHMVSNALQSCSKGMSSRRFWSAFNQSSSCWPRNCYIW